MWIFETGSPLGRAVNTLRLRIGALILPLLAAMLVVTLACGSEQEQQQGGAKLFADNCARCHGGMADGTATGPPLVHRLYEPGHHPDFSFQSAVKNGVVAHHWGFGDMPPVAGLSEDEVTEIIAHIRDLQREGGIIK